jgi:hypothetical protein
VKATEIERGNLLKLKKDNPYGIEGDDLLVRVNDVRYPNGYKTPWIYDTEGNAYRPSDFAYRVTNTIPEPRRA